MFYTDQEHTLYVEAIRTVPGMMSCMISGRADDGRSLLSGYFQRGKELHIQRELMWSILFTATMHWNGNLMEQLAEHVEISPDSCAQQLGRLAVLWETEGCPRA